MREGQEKGEIGEDGEREGGKECLMVAKCFVDFE